MPSRTPRPTTRPLEPVDGGTLVYGLEADTCTPVDAADSVCADLLPHDHADRLRHARRSTARTARSSPTWPSRSSPTPTSPSGPSRPAAGRHLPRRHAVRRRRDLRQPHAAPRQHPHRQGAAQRRRWPRRPRGPRPAGERRRQRLRGADEGGRGRTSPSTSPARSATWRRRLPGGGRRRRHRPGRGRAGRHRPVRVRELRARRLLHRHQERRTTGGPPKACRTSTASRCGCSSTCSRGSTPSSTAPST